MDPEKVDAFLANEIRKEAKKTETVEHDGIIDPLPDATTEDLLISLRSRGYESKLID